MAITASVQPESAGPHPLQYRFSKEGMDHIAQNRPGSDLDGLVRVWPNTSGLEASRCAGIIWPCFWQEATGPLPISHFQTRFRSSTDIPDNTAQKPARIRFSSGRFCHVLAKGLRSGSKPMCKNHPARFRPVLPSRTGPAANRIRHVYWVAICLPM